MKRMATFIVLLMLVFTISTSGQLYKDSWRYGFGFSYPRLVNTSSLPQMINFGAFGLIQNDFSEHTAMRLYAKVGMMETKHTLATPVTTTNILVGTGELDLIYSFVPCEEFVPYLVFGGGLLAFSHTDPVSASLQNESFIIDFMLTTGFGARWNYGEDWGFTAEFNYHTTPTSQLDGDASSNKTSGLLGGWYDSYLTIDVGLLYYMSTGEPSKYCNVYHGLAASSDVPSANIDYDRIEKIVQDNIPREVVKEVVVEKPVPMETRSGQQTGSENVYSSSGEKWVLVGVNFDFNSTKLTPEAYPVLFHAVQVLLRNPGMKVEIQGFTDNIGSEKFNQRLSQKRAQTVKNYLTARGVAKERLIAVGYGSANPISDNKTATGRAINRRIEFKIIR